MYAQRLAVEIAIGESGLGSGERRLCPLDWLDSFCMRNFTGAAEFDDTLPVTDGLIEAGFRVSPERLAAAMGEWFTRRGKGGGQTVHVSVRPEEGRPAPASD